MDSLTAQIMCPLHPKEAIKRIDTEFGCDKDLFCIECLLHTDNPVAISAHLKPVDEFLSSAASYYNGIRQRSLENVETPDEYLEILNKQTENLEIISKHIEDEKKRVDAKLDELTQYVVKHINLKRDEYFHLLDKQLFNYRYGYIFLEKQLRKAFPKVDDTSLYPTLEELIEKYEKLQNATQLMAYIKNIKEDLNETKLFVTEDGLQLTPDEGRRFIIKTTIKKLDSYKFKAPTLINPEGDIEKAKGNFEKAVGKILDEVFDLANEIEDPSGEAFPKSSLLKGSDWAQIKKWMEKEFANKKPKLVYKGTKDGMTATAFHKCADNKGPTLTVIKSKFDKIFGGFIDQPFGSKNVYINSKVGWLFSINAKAKYIITDPTTHAQYGAYDYATYGPTFGGGHDIYLAPDFTTNSNYCNRYSYNFPDNTTLTGGYNFQVEEVEVYSYGK